MPHTTFLCPDENAPNRSDAGEVAIADCLNCARTRLDRTCDYNATMLQLMVEQADDRISPTRLLDCPRKIALKRRVEYTIDPVRSWAKVRGTVFHAGLETHADPEAKCELEMVRTVTVAGKEHTVNGRLDLAYLQMGCIEDWKTVKRLWAAMEPKESHLAQLSTYRWLAVPYGWTLPIGVINYVDMEQVRRFVVDLWEPDETEAWIQERLPDLAKAYNPRAKLAPRFKSTHPDAWMCRYCDVAEQCKALHKEGQ